VRREESKEVALHLLRETVTTRIHQSVHQLLAEILHATPVPMLHGTTVLQDPKRTTCLKLSTERRGDLKALEDLEPNVTKAPLWRRRAEGQAR
jgi:hypothetical protein